MNNHHQEGTPDERSTLLDQRQVSLRAKAFAEQVERARRISKGPEMFLRCAEDMGDQPEFRVLRRWNSHTPALMDVHGGGYFLRWHGSWDRYLPDAASFAFFRSQRHSGFKTSTWS